MNIHDTSTSAAMHYMHYLTSSTRSLASSYDATPAKACQIGVLVQREVLCYLFRAALQNNRVGSAIKPGHINGIA